MKRTLVILLVAILLPITMVAQDAQLVLQDGTPVKLRTTENLSSHDAVTGQTVDFEVMEDIYAGDVLVAKKGSIAIGTITEAQHKRTMGRGGKLDITIDYLRLINGEKAQLRGVKQGKAGGHTAAMVGSMVAVSLVVWPAAPLFLFMHGKDMTMPKGTAITAYVDGDFNIDQNRNRSKVRQLEPPPSAQQATAEAPKACSNILIDNEGREVCRDAVK